MNTSRDPAPAPDIDTAAAAWLARRRSGRMNTADHAEFELWLARDPAHREAFDLAERMWAGVEAVRSDPRVIALRERGLGRRAPNMWAAGSAVAAGVALAASAAWGVKSGVLDDLMDRPIEQHFRTSVGQRTTVVLPDGSTVTLDTDTVVTTRETNKQRLVELEKGQAFFRVARDPTRPFVVAAGDKTVTATGTAFDVRVEPERFQVTLVEGEVRVEAPIVTSDGARSQHKRAAKMEAGWRLVAEADRAWTVAEIDLARETSWLHGQLTYESTPLGQVVAEMNRYSDRKIVLSDDKIAARRLSGVYKAGDIDEFVRMLESYRIARVEHRSDKEVRIVAR